MSEDPNLAAARWITAACGSYPDVIKADGDGFIFETRPTKIALDAFPCGECGENAIYEVIRNEISGDEEGWYYETILYDNPPADGEAGSIVEGVYSRRIEVKGDIEAFFHGRLVFTTGSDHAQKAALGRRQHYERTLDELTGEITAYLDQFIANIKLIGAPYSSQRMQEKMAQVMRAITDQNSAHD
ncbi:MAG: hypothetical protein CL949_09995 [Erythrobacter sp.]|nr:hypothetical protein [Erythrobacter sp.]